MAHFISPNEAARLLNEKKAILYDVREADEYAAAYIPGSRLRPLSVLEKLPNDHDADKIPIFFCSTGRRTKNRQDALTRWSQNTGTRILDGGLAAWKKIGLPVETAPFVKKPSLNGQALVLAGLLVILGVLLTSLMPTYANWLNIFTGSILILCGATGFAKIIAKILSYMPWNKRVDTAPAADPKTYTTK